MAIDKMLVNVVDVGQGQCTFVELYNGTTLANTLLFDCGSDKYSTETDKNLTYIKDKVASMGTPAFDCIFFSHSDSDHISLTKALLELFPSNKKPRVKMVWYGGDYNKYAKYDRSTKTYFNILDALVASGYCTQNDLGTPGSNYTGYDTSQKRFAYHLWQSPDKKVSVYAIAYNVIAADPDWDDQDEPVTGKTPEQLNRVSMVCYLGFAGRSYVICGDATNQTMAAINTLFTAGTSVFDKNAMTTLPHHGSRATGLAVASGKTASWSAILTVNTFAATLKPQTLSVSAYEKHKHPSLELMRMFIPQVTTPILRDARLKTKNSHLISAYVDINLSPPTGVSIVKGHSYSFESQSNTFSTKYSNWLAPEFSYKLGLFTTPSAGGGVKSGVTLNEFASWVFTTVTSGGTTITGWDRLGGTCFTSISTSTMTSPGGRALEEAASLETGEAVIPEEGVTQSNERPPLIREPARARRTAMPMSPAWRNRPASVG